MTDILLLFHANQSIVDFFGAMTLYRLENYRRMHSVIIEF